MEEAAVSVHYLGHGSFLLTFQEGLSVLTDPGESRAYGLNSPIYPVEDSRPEVVTLSHDHPDHAGGAFSTGPHVLLRGEGPYESQGLTVTPIPTYESTLEAPDNVSFLFEYRGLKILHLGDCQALMAAGDRDALIQTLYPDRYDLVLLPIGFVADILAEAASFVSLIKAGTIVPMHYWSPNDRDAFLRLLDGKSDEEGRAYRVRLGSEAPFLLSPGGPQRPYVEVVGLNPGPAVR